MDTPYPYKAGVMVPPSHDTIPDGVSDGVPILTPFWDMCSKCPNYGIFGPSDLDLSKCLTFGEISRSRVGHVVSQLLIPHLTTSQDVWMR